MAFTICTSAGSGAGDDGVRPEGVPREALLWVQWKITGKCSMTFLIGYRTWNESVFGERM
ncbi:WSSV491 [White spot syndrome virus]|uniref:WSSV491 n=1 Tax=White spot syndrome virus TaxID=342409 RepID=A0A2I6SCE7_9VIRU|nr:WSSV491 [White spot syndrome virus]